MAAKFRMLSVPHLIVIFIVALIVFGPEKIPELARNLGKIMAEFRRLTGDLRSTFEGHLRDLEREADTRRIAAPDASPAAGMMPTAPCAVPGTVGATDAFACAQALFRRIRPMPLRLANPSRPNPSPSAESDGAHAARRSDARSVSDAAWTFPPRLRWRVEAIGTRAKTRTSDRWRPPHLLSARRARAPRRNPARRCRSLTTWSSCASGSSARCSRLAWAWSSGLLVSKRFINFIVQPMLVALRANHLEDKLYYTSPAGYVGLYINLGLYLGVVCSPCPGFCIRSGCSSLRGFTSTSASATASFIISAMLLFLCGIAVGYFGLLPLVLTRVIGFAGGGPISPLISVNEYFSLILVVLLGLGLIFEMPVVVFILSILNIVTPKFLLKNFRYAMLVITVLAAIVTPTPDATTMLVFMAPMIVLYFISVLVSYVVLRRKRWACARRAEAE